MFKICCDNTYKEKYSLQHNPKPIQMCNELSESIEYLLWYSPNIKSSYQAYDDMLIENKLYENIIFKSIIEEMNIRDEDVFIENNIPDYIRSNYENKVCKNCQKIIITRRENSNESKVMCLLRHIRNSIAHGCFNIFDNGMLIGFDYDKGRNDKLTGIIKIYPDKLLKGLKRLNQGFAKEQIFKEVFKNMGYNIYSDYIFKKSYDFKMEKEGIIFKINIVVIKKGYIYEECVKKYINMFSDSMENDISVLIIDNAKLIKRCREIILNNNNIIILDKNGIEKLLCGEDILFDLYKRKNKL